jgi:transposase
MANARTAELGITRPMTQATGLEKNRTPGHARVAFSQITFSLTHGQSVFGGPTMLTAMTEEDWTIVLRVFAASRSRRGDKGRNDRKFLEALHYFVVHNITWRALPEKFGHWNSVWKRFWRLSRSGTFEAFFDALAAMSETAHLVQMFDSTVVRAHVSAAGAKGGSMIRRLAARVAVSLPRFT